MLDFYLTRYTAWRETQNVETRLAAEARLVAYDLGNVPLEELNRVVHRAGNRAQTRVTVITHTGVVLADSQHDPETMENHANRPEVRQALQGRTGASVRHSVTLDRDLCYVAIPFTYQGKRGFVLRLAVPLVEVSQAVSEVRWRIVYASVITAALALLLAYFFSLRISRRIRRIKMFAERLLISREPAALSSEASDELGALSRALNDMGRQLRDSMDKLSAESARRDAILASMVEGVLAVGHDLRILFCNDAFAQVLGGGRDRIIGKPLLAVLRDSALFTLLEKVLATGEETKDRIQLTAASDRAFAAYATPLMAEEKRGAVVVLHEITDIERLERVRRDFVANVSHELRTPLAAILGYAETLLDGAVEDANVNRKFLETIKSHAIRLNNISSDLLTLSELDAGVSTTPPSTFSLKETIAAAVRSVETEARQRSVRLTFSEIEDLEIRGYKLRLEQTLVNLLDNAIKFNRADGEVRLEAGRTPEGQVKIAIADTGCGIPFQDLSRIFERFYRVDRARSRQVGGTGLGLAIVKHAIELMNGRIEVMSELGVGSTFTVLIPVEGPGRSPQSH
ncbi:MAG TPA: ATP-binding protein [Bryobacteraceae bacterium]